MWTHLEDKDVAARKGHRCLLCDRMIPKGMTYRRRTGVESGEGFITMHMHRRCEKATADWSEMDWELGCDPADFRQMLKEQPHD